MPQYHVFSNHCGVTKAHNKQLFLVAVVATDHGIIFPSTIKMRVGTNQPGLASLFRNAGIFLTQSLRGVAMIKRSICLLLMLSTLPTLAQTYDLAGQLRVIKDLIPASSRLGMLYNPSRPNIEALISNASQDTGLVVVKSPVKSARDMTAAIRSLSKYEVDFIFMIDDKTVTGTRTIKFVVKQTMRRKIPVFTVSPNAFEGGAYGWLVENGSSWRIKINGKVQDRFDISIPENANFVVE